MFLSTDWTEHLLSTHRLFQEANIRFCLQYGSRSCSRKHIPPLSRFAFIRFVGLPPERRGGSSTPGGLPKESVKTQPEKDGEYWELTRERRLLVLVHPNKRSHLFQPGESKTIPASIKRIGYARTYHFHLIRNDGLRAGQLKQEGESSGGLFMDW